LMYTARMEGSAPPLHPLRIQYKDYAVWQQRQLKNGTLLQDKEYWIQQLGGELPVLALQGDKARPAVKTYNGAAVHATIPAALVRTLKAFSTERGSTLFTGLLSVVNALLYRYTSQKDIITGSPVSGRGHIDLEDQIGVYINTLPLRVRINDEDSFHDLLDNVRNVALEAYRHQAYPFDELIRDIHLPHDTGRSALFDIMVTFRTVAGGEAQPQRKAASLTITSFSELEPQHSRFDLIFYFTELGETLQLMVEYNTDIYSRDTILRLTDHFGQLLKELLRQPDRPIRHLDYLDEKEKYLLLTAFNDTMAGYPKDRTVTQLFEQQVQKTPDNIALIFEDTFFTYHQLNTSANRLGNYLRRHYAVREEDLIAIKLERSHWLIIAILGILKAGGAYVPIDPAYPAERIDHMIEDSGCRLIIDEDELARFGKESEEYPGEDLPCVNIPGHLAYVMYTSGSTGQPKGVMVEHTGIVRLVKSANYVTLEGRETLLSTGAISFDATVFEYWGMLLNGGRLVLSRQETLMDAKLLREEIRKRNVGMMWFTAGWLSQLIDTDIEVFNGLRTVLAGGDRLSPVHIRALRLRYPDLEIINGYGPTENTTFSLTYRIGIPLSNIPIGKPISNSTVYILTGDDLLQPIGVTGEICVGGDGLARGYWHQPGLTAEKFVPHPFSPGSRIYRTGDLGRWLPDGNIEFIGRKDDQIKIRGFRVEPGEIASMLQQYEAVDSAEVLAMPNSKGEKELVAYITGRNSLDMSVLRAWLKKKLPAYMIPGHIIQLPAWTLTPNGKLDRKSLPNPWDMELSDNREYTAPGDRTAERLVAIWEDLLGKKKISVQDHFFDLGGHSLLATHLAGAVHKAFGIRLTLKQLFTHPVLEDQVLLIRQSRGLAFTGLSPAAGQTDYPLSSSQRLFWIACQFEQANIAYNMPGIYQFEGDLAPLSLEYAFSALVERHESLRTVFRENEKGEVRQFILTPREAGTRVLYPDLRPEEQDKIRDYLLSESRRPFDLARGPLLRASLVRTGEKQWIFAYVMHHIIGDARSMTLLIRELLALYNAHLRGESNPLQPLRIQYKDYTVWQQRQLEEGAFSEHKSWWLRQFEGQLPVLLLPTDKVRPDIKTYNGGMVHMIIPPSPGRELSRLLISQDSSLFMGLLTAVNILLYKYTGQTDIVIGTSIAGREHPDLEDQIGYYLNTLALRTRFSEDDNYVSLLGRVREMTLDAYEYQSFPFEELVNALQVDRDISRNNLFDVLVVMRNADFSGQESSRQGLDNVQVSTYGQAVHTVSKFDLTFSFMQMGEEIRTAIEYNSDLFERPSIEKIAGDLQRLLEAIVSLPEEPIKRLEYASREEQLRSAVTFNERVNTFSASISSEF